MSTTVATDEGVSVRGLRRDEYDQLIDLGVFDGQRIQLIEGVLLEMSPQGSRHHWLVTMLAQLFIPAFAGRYTVTIQGPLAISAMSEPEPDLAIVDEVRRDAKPTTAHVVIEVSDSTRRLDLGRKARLYATAGVPLYLVFDLRARQVVVHEDPSPEGYLTVSRRGAGDALQVLGVDLPLDELL